ncbi:S-adenosyl-L-methionine-dependent methyltransferase, partial [Basidiobolus meristosporus CBS 931.73]
DPNSVISAIDLYANANPMMHIGNQKGKFIDELIKERSTDVMVELGGYLGYSALRFSSILPPNGHYYSFELNPEFAAIAQKIIDHAGLSSKVTIIVGEFKVTSQAFFSTYPIKQVDFVFIDHWKDVYVQDLKIIEELHWLRPGSIVVADNIIVPGAPEYKAYIEAETEK